MIDWEKLPPDTLVLKGSDRLVADWMPELWKDLLVLSQKYNLTLIASTDRKYDNSNSNS